MKKNKGSAALLIIFMALIVILVVGGAFALYFLKGGKKISAKDITDAEKLIGLNFTLKEKK